MPAEGEQAAAPQRKRRPRNRRPRRNQSKDKENAGEPTGEPTAQQAQEQKETPAEDPSQAKLAQSAKSVSLPEPPSDFTQTLWYKASGGDIAFCKFVVTRAQGLGDPHALSDEETLRRIRVLYNFESVLKAELKPEGSVDTTESENLKTAGSIVNEASRVVKAWRVCHEKDKELETAGKLERMIWSEVLELTTDLLLSKATVMDREDLLKWIRVLENDESEGVEDVEEQHKLLESVFPGLGRATKSAEPTSDDAKRKKKPGKASINACVTQVKAFLEFVDEYASPHSYELPTPVEVNAKWELEIMENYMAIRIDAQEERRRHDVAADLQALLRSHKAEWRGAQVAAFGSSLSHFGSKHSDVDLSVNLTPRDPLDTTATKHLAKTTDNSDPLFLSELRMLVSKTMEKVQAKEDKEVDDTMRFFWYQLELLQNAISYQLSVCDAEGHSDAKKEAERQVAMAKRKSDAMMQVKNALARQRWKITMVLASARVPIIKCEHPSTGVEVDVGLDNILAKQNTILLRSYASFDERCRILGLAVKKWAKSRGVSDASQGFFSSYTYTILVIYFLQTQARILPDLQDPLLLSQADVKEINVDGANIAFCDVETARRMVQLPPCTLSVAELLRLFFRFYASVFDFSKHVISIRHPFDVREKQEVWANPKQWRLSVQDPLEWKRDLGCTLQFQTQQQILTELKRADGLLDKLESFADSVCAPLETKKRNKRETYWLTCYQADSKRPNLGKREINNMLTKVSKRWSVGKVLRNGQGWHVELRGPGIAKCPKEIKAKSRIDMDGRRLVLHHHQLYSHEPCAYCGNPEHSSNTCNGAEDDKFVLRLDGSK